MSSAVRVILTPVMHSRVKDDNESWVSTNVEGDFYQVSSPNVQPDIVASKKL